MQRLPAPPEGLDGGVTAGLRAALLLKRGDVAVLGGRDGAAFLAGRAGAALLARRAAESPLRGRAGAILLAAFVGVTVLLLGAGQAAAHAELESSSPQDGATLKSAPAALTFKFGEALLETGNAITLTPSGAERLPLGKPRVDGPTMSVSWPASAPAGAFTAAFRVVSADGHPIEGSITFTVQTPTGATSSTSADPSPAQVSGAPTGLPSAVASEPSPIASPASAASESQPGTGALAWVLSIGVIGLVGALAALWVTRRNKP